MGKYIAGHERVISAMARASNKGVAAVADALEDGGVLVRNHARDRHPRLFRGTKGPDAAGQAAITAYHEATGRFTTRTGDLAGSIHVRDAKLDSGGGMVVEVVAGGGDDTNYAEKVEAQYPFMVPALAANTDEIKALVSSAMKEL